MKLCYLFLQNFIFESGLKRALKAILAITEKGEQKILDEKLGELWNKAQKKHLV